MANQFIENYAELSQLKRASVRDISRKVVLDLLGFTSEVTGLINRSSQKPRVQFLYIHHIFRDEEVLLRRLLEKLSKHHSFISYEEGINKVLTGTIDKPYISVSSDDGLKNNLRAAAILNEYGIKGCFFVCPPMIGETNYEKINKFSLQQLHLPAVEFMDWNDIEKLQQQGHEIGGHTLSHVNLAKCHDAQLAEEIGNCYTELVMHCGYVKHFAYPYGRYFHFTEKARKVVFSSGFESCASAERGCHISLPGKLMRKEDLFIRRDHVLLTWPINHILYFMARNVQKAAVQNNYSPYESNSNNKQ